MWKMNLSISVNAEMGDIIVGRLCKLTHSLKLCRAWIILGGKTVVAYLAMDFDVTYAARLSAEFGHGSFIIFVVL